jgi:raffinose/stachyose/melibiose transport system permease protein
MIAYVRKLPQHRLRELIVSVILLPIALVWIYPFLWTISAAFKTNNEVFSSGLNLLPQQPQFENFTRAWTEANIEQYFLNTMIVAVVTVLLTVTTTGMIGYALGRYRFPGKRLIVGILIATVFLPKGYTIIPVFELLRNLGLLNSLAGIILAQSGQAHVIFVLLFMGYFNQLPKELEEAAIVDGAGFVRIFAQIMLPLARPVVATVVIMKAIASWNDFLLPLVVTLSRPDLRTLSVGMYAFRGEYFTDWSGMAAAAAIAIAPIILLFLLMQRFFIEGIAGAVKG